MDLRARFGLNIIAVENSGEVLEHVKPDYIFQKNDVLLVSGSRDGLARLSEWLESHS